ncbi:two pore domain potassium channel family protein [Halieaceae bacterium IMCC14734]|uniref:Two pore domain potassium channel family protein n=1 Tax=Candidatus Litorirhabdus singularis TaxID=2518993 RepID=A0ABT3TK70_9GAMM|nr:ion channel [Candidatus Litorirhabdus singularis]MCX2982702.1 two pore domain potassium channel family protein [Candidatus Litorirhabdus singularis]
MIAAMLLAFGLVSLTFLFHYRVLLWLGSRGPRLGLSTQALVLVIVVTLFLVHIAEIGIYAFTYGMSVSFLDLGVFEGAAVTDAMSFLYYSGVIYTTLGLGDIEPQGHIRFITAMEALSGFLLITWSASFTFLAMGRLWPWENHCATSIQHVDVTLVTEKGEKQ